MNCVLENITQKRLIAGIKTRTSFLEEQNLSTSRIAPLVATYWQKCVGHTLQYRVHPGVLYAVYFHYHAQKDNEDFSYDYLIGEEVSCQPSEDFQTVEILTGTYRVYTPIPGPAPFVVIDTWKHIHKDTACRAYQTDFEVYPSPLENLQKTHLKVYVGEQAS